MKRFIVISSVVLLICMTLGLQAQTKGSRDVPETSSQTTKSDDTKSVKVEEEIVKQVVKTVSSKTEPVVTPRSDDSKASTPAARQTTRQENERTAQPAYTQPQQTSRTNTSSSSNTERSSTPDYYDRTAPTENTRSQQTSRTSSSSSNTSRSSSSTDYNRSAQTTRQNSYDDDFYNYTSPRITQPEKTKTTTSTTKTPAQTETIQRSVPETTRNKTYEAVKEERAKTTLPDKDVTYKVFTPETPAEQPIKAKTPVSNAEKGYQSPAGKDIIRDNKIISPSNNNQPFDPSRDNRPPHPGDGDNNYGGNHHGDGDNNHGGYGNNHSHGYGHNNHGWNGYHNNHGWNWRPNYGWNWFITINNYYGYNPYYSPYYYPYYDWTWYHNTWNWYNPHYSWNWYYAYHNFGYVSYANYYNWYPSHHWIVYPSFDQYYAWENSINEVTGYLIIDDLDTSYPYSYGMVTRRANGDYDTFYFDRYGNRLAKRLIDKYGHLKKKIYVEVRGYRNYDTQTIQVTSMQRVKWNQNVYLSFYYHPRWSRFSFWRWG